LRTGPLVDRRLPTVSRRAAGEHLVPPHRHADDEHDQGQSSKPDRYVHEREIARQRADDQQRHCRRDDGRDHTEPDHVRSPVVMLLTVAFAMTFKAAALVG
jgi:hypothetical protein